MAEFDLRVVVRAVDEATAPLRRIGAQLHRLGRRSGLDRVGRAGRELGIGLGRVGVEAVRLGVRLGGLGAAGGAGLFGLAARFANVGDSIAKTADKLGVGVVELQRLRYAGQLAGVETQTFDMALQRFTRRAAEAAAGTGEAKGALEHLGIALKDEEGRMRPTEALLGDVADAMAGIEDPALRVRIAFKLFDSEGVSMVTMLAKGKDAMRAAGDEAERQGVLTEEQARAAERFKDEMTRFGNVTSHIGHVLGAELLPVLRPLMEETRKWFMEIRPGLVEWFRRAIKELGEVASWVRDTWVGLTRGMDAWWKGVAAASPVLAALVGWGSRLLHRVGLLRLAIGALATVLGARLLLAVIRLFAPLAKLTWALMRVAWWMGAGTVRMVGRLIGGWSQLGTHIGRLRSRLGGLIASLASTAKAMWALAVRGVRGLILRLRTLTVSLLRASGAMWTLALRGARALMLSLRGLAASLVRATGAMWALAAQGVRALWPALLRLSAALAPVIAATWAWTVALLANPITWIVAGVVALAGAVWLLVRNWDGIAEWFGELWAGVREAFDLSGLWDWLASFSLVQIGSSWVSGLWDGVAAVWAGLRQVFDLSPLWDWLASFSLVKVGLDWVASLWEGIDEAWSGLVRWFGEAVAELLDWIPDWMKGGLGISVEGGQAPGEASPTAVGAQPTDGATSWLPSLFAPPAPTLFGGGDGQVQDVRVGGEVRIRFENAPRGMRVEGVETDNPDVPFDVHAGYAMGVP